MWTYYLTVFAEVRKGMPFWTCSAHVAAQQSRPGTKLARRMSTGVSWCLCKESIMDDTVLGPVVPTTAGDTFGYGFRIQKPGIAIRHPVTLVFETEQDAKHAREIVKGVLDKAIAVIEVA